MLAREVLRLRGTITRSGEGGWPVMVDMFFYRDPEEVDKAQEEAKAAAAALAAGGAAEAEAAAAPEWDPTTTAGAPAENIDWAAEPAGGQTTDWAAEPAGGATGWDAGAGNSGW